MKTEEFLKSLRQLYKYAGTVTKSRHSGEGYVFVYVAQVGQEQWTQGTAGQ